jgi:hypothetical protein
MSRRPLIVVALLVIAVPLIVVAQARRPGTQAPAAPPSIPIADLPRDSAGNLIFRREVYSYQRGARRDPFVSLILTGDMRPLVADLEIAGIMYDPTGRNSFATLKDASTGEIYRARVGSVFGRVRVTAIRQREVAVAVDEFGFTRQAVLSITVPSRGGRTP